MTAATDWKAVADEMYMYAVGLSIGGKTDEAAAEAHDRVRHVYDGCIEANTGTTDPLRDAALRIANEVPWEGWTSSYCHHCNREFMDPMKRGYEYIDRRAHEPDCSWIALRDALGLESN